MTDERDPVEEEDAIEETPEGPRWKTVEINETSERTER
jgi:hypothetical protein